MFWWDKNMSHQLNDLCKVNDMKIQIILGYYMYVKFRNKIRLIQCIYQQLTMALVYRPRPVCTTGTNSRPTLLMLCMFCWVSPPYALQWRHNGRDGVSNHQPHDCLLNRLFKRRSKKKFKSPRHWPLCEEFTGDRWIPRTNGQSRGKCFHVMTSSWSSRSAAGWCHVINQCHTKMCH